MRARPDIAAEFTWPNGTRVETWGLRFEFRNTAENDGITTPFFCPCALERDDFLAISPEDGKPRTRTLPDFKAFWYGIEDFGEIEACVDYCRAKTPTLIDRPAAPLAA